MNRGQIPTTHGMSKTKEYACWKSMRRRCSSPKASEYQYYGGRGITVCPEWENSFEAFFSHMGFAPTPSHSIERDDVNGDYEPSNCRWATKAEQAANRRPPLVRVAKREKPAPKPRMPFGRPAAEKAESKPIVGEAPAAKPAKKAKPTIRERAREAVCPECSGQVVRRSAKGPFPTFCSPECKKAHGNRHIVEGRAVIAFLKAWRIDRAQGEIAQGAFAQVCQIVDQFNARDNAHRGPSGERRQRADLYAAKILVDKTSYFDRQPTR